MKPTSTIWKTFSEQKKNITWGTLYFILNSRVVISEYHHQRNRFWEQAWQRNTGPIYFNIFCSWQYYKMAGYNRHILRLLIFAKMLFRSLKAFFSDKYFLQQISKFQKKLILEKKTFWGIVSFYTNSTPNLPPLPILKKSKKKIRAFWEILVFQVHSMAILL